MKSMWLPLAAIFFMTYLYRAGGGGHGLLGTPLDPLLNVAADTLTTAHMTILGRTVTRKVEDKASPMLALTVTNAPSFQFCDYSPIVKLRKSSQMSDSFDILAGYQM